MEKKKKNDESDSSPDPVIWHIVWLPVLVSDLVYLIYWINHPVSACSWQLQTAWYCQLHDVPLLEIITLSILSIIVWYQAERLQRQRGRMLIRCLILAY